MRRRRKYPTRGTAGGGCLGGFLGTTAFYVVVFLAFCSLPTAVAVVMELVEKDKQERKGYTNPPPK